ncbi:MAG: efflux RND transporter periplasmic adaptor subunit, partial [Alphaproteobacteria bacterium]
ETLHVEEGQQVTKGELLFALESSREVAARNAAQARLEQAEASLKLARIALERARKLFEQGVVPRSRLDDAQTAFDTNSAAAAAARAQFEDALTRLARRSVAAPVSGKVEQVYYRPGEIVTAGRPVVSLLPPGNLKVKFYVPGPVRPLFATGQLVAFSCDGCPEGLMARVTFVSSEAEYAPPVIFSREERSKLLFMVEARPLEGGSSVPVGQPVTVTLPEQQYPAGS